MDDLYDNLDNYNEETTIAELREENKELKCKLEEYAFTLEKLQNEFDMLESEHKKLEQNYSSLLKTAKSEIERKSLIITKLNIEKDNMVLGAIQNQNINHKKRRTEPQKYQKSESEDGRRCNNSPSEVSKPFSNTQTRLLDLVNSTQGNLKSSRNIEVKENIMLKDDATKSRARISNRRKSMPIFSMDSAILTDEDERTSTGSGKEFICRELTARKLTDQFMHEKLMEEKIFGQYTSSNKESQRSRNSNLYDRERCKEKYDSNQRHKRNYSSSRKCSLEGQKVSSGRGKGALDLKRFSPNRRRVSRERRISPERRRLSPDRRRFGPDGRRVSSERRKISPERRRISPERRRVSPVRRRVSPERYRIEPCEHDAEFCENPEYDRHRKLNERSHNQDFDRPKYSTQDKCPIKHKLADLKDSNIKRLRMDQEYDEDRWKVKKSGVLESAPQSLNFEYLNNMSCQSPEQTFLDGLAQAPREIKLTSTMKLDDPRISSKKYVTMTHKGKPELISVQNSSIDIKIIDTRGWDMIKRMKLPDALLQKPPSIASPLTLFQKSVSTTTIARGSADSNYPEAVGFDKLGSIKRINTPEPVLHKQLTDKPESVLNKQLTDKLEPELYKQCIEKPDFVLNKQLTDKPEPVPNFSAQKPLFTNFNNEIYMDIDNSLSDISIESGEICDSDEENKNTKQITERNSQEKIKQPGSTKLDDNYKIPKKGITEPVKHSNNIKIHISAKEKDNEIPNTIVESHVDKKKVIKIHDSREGHKKKDNRKVTKTDITQDTETKNVKNICKSDFQCDFQNNITTKDIEDDLELSDDATDNTDAQSSQPIIYSNEKSDKYDTRHKFAVHKSQLSSYKPKIEFDAINSVKNNHDFKERKNNLETEIKETAKDSKKLKPKKKSLKLKDTKELFVNKDNLISLDKPTNELPKSNNTQSSVDKQVKQNENRSEKSSDNNITCAYKESKTKKTLEPKHAVHHDKSAKMKQNKPNKPPEHLAQKNLSNKEKETKVNNIENKTKFSELFGDSSSLVSPEDLGVVPTVARTNNLAYFEDAEYAMDTDTLQAAIAITSMKKTDNKIQENKSQTNFDELVEKTTPITNEINYTTGLPVLPTEPIPVPNDYQNLQPVILLNEHNVINSIIISSGTQPQCVERSHPITNGNKTDMHVLQCVKPMVIQDLTLQALATSTPQKIWNQNILLEPEPTRNSKCESNESQESADKTPTIDHSGNIDTTQTQLNDEPDLKLFVTRRRKVKRK